MTNSSPWKDPAFFNLVNHLFRLGPSIPWRTVSHHQRLFLAISTEMSQLSTPPKKWVNYQPPQKNESTINPPKKNRCEKSPSFSHVPTGRFLSTTFFRWPRIHAAWSSGRRRLAAWNVWRIQLLGDDWLLVAPWLVGLDHFLWLSIYMI